MCRECVIQESPEREGVVCEDGAYTVNLRLCAVCKRRGGVRNVQRHTTESEDGSETADYVHVCEWCGHEVAVHHYALTVNTAENRHEYSMHCILCGDSEDSRSIDPIDPQLMHAPL